MRCPACNHEDREGRRFCAQCGASLDRVRCPGCESLNEPGESFCGECGKPLSEAVAQPASAVPPASPSPPPALAHPAAFAQDRCQVKRLLGEGRKPRGDVEGLIEKAAGVLVGAVGIEPTTPSL